MARLSVFQKLLLGIALLSALGVAAILTAGRRQTGAGMPGTSCRLSDGSRLSVAQVHWGSTHQYTPRVPWLRRQLNRVSPRLFPLRQQRAMGYHLREPALMVWLTRDRIPRGSTLDLVLATAYDSHGCRFWPCIGLGPRMRRPPSESRYVLFTALQRFPRHEASFRLKIQDRSGEVVGELTVSPGRVPVSVPALWHPLPLPITRHAGNLSVTLAEVRTWLPEEDGGIMRMEAAFRFEQDGRPADAWEADLGCMTLSDPEGNSRDVRPLGTLPDGRRLLSALCTSQPAWKLRVPVFPASTLPAPAGERWQVRGVPVPKRGQAVVLGKSGSAHGVALEAWAVAGPGAYEYRSGVPRALDPVPERWRSMAAGDNLGFFPDWAKGVWTAVAGIVHVAGSAHGVPIGCRLTLRAVDEQGRVCRVKGPNGVRETMCFGIDVPPGSQRLNLEFAVRRGREVEFVFAPPRPASCRDWQQEGQMAIIDAHIHVWTDDFDRYPISAQYKREEMKPPTFRPEELLAHCRPSGVERVVLIQMSFYGFDNSHMLDVMRAYPGVFSGVAVIDVTAERPDDEMLRLADQGVRGFRIQPRGNPEEWLDTPGYRRMFSAAARHNLAMCPLMGPEALPGLDRMCAEFPETPVVIDHLCRIGASGPIEGADIDRLCAMARHPRVHVKVSAFYGLGKKQPPHDDLIPLIRRVHGPFGADRLMWASDCPYQVVRETYEDGLSLVRDRLTFLSPEERQMVLHDTAARVFFGS